MTAHYGSSLFNRDIPNREKEPGKGQWFIFSPQATSLQFLKPQKVPSSTVGSSHVHLKAQLDWLCPILHRADGLSATSCVTPTSSHQVNPGNLEKTSLIHEKKKRKKSARFAKYEHDLSLKVSSGALWGHDTTFGKHRIVVVKLKRINNRVLELI
ncbi:uncharacterized protein P174DRAFT_418864 [Aspergillus novofumigatus IBT 16806]|uniref:Uncharacterized protein n=1 Tax=Aspergillus novofumigatus (strain IBT 16806) TaxID=1392255 RepID=A0A2I1CB62_ASPN1|nr:uncharacterized protein P174DRAFT_418864 [Aspergillus novofumigatus IBT 16806]PKX94889.1 hypothetical protein P174DRAFT_418864 [Aspergillus novofumigatus IBT 16806]